MSPLSRDEFEKKLKWAFEQVQHVMEHLDEYPDRFIITSEGQVLPEHTSTGTSGSYNVAVKD